VVLGGDLTVAGLFTILVALAMVVLPLRTLVRTWNARDRAREAAAAGAEFLGRRGDAGQDINAEFLQPITKRLEIIGLSYREPGTGKMVLEDMSFAVPAGARVAFVGADPKERRTLAHILARFLEPTAGEVKADGKNLRFVTQESLRTQVAVVTPEPMTFTDTVANNIGCGDPNYSLPQIIEAAKVAHAHQFVQRLPYGYETRIGELGHALRPGEEFRIALARAILRDPSVIVIEEPAEPFDTDTVTLLEDTYARMGVGRTLLFLPNRESTTRQTDRVFILKNGKILASGKHEDLMESNAFYRRLNAGDPLPSATKA
jgi:ABC-type multidrug transport system fused ATPase/permease subunit